MQHQRGIQRTFRTLAAFANRFRDGHDHVKASFQLLFGNSVLLSHESILERFAHLRKSTETLEIVLVRKFDRLAGMTKEKLAAALIRVFEGLHLVAYPDSGGVMTIGFGHTAGVHQGMTCTVDQAIAWLAYDAAPLFTLMAGKPLFASAAYVSFGYNCGYHALELVLAGKATLTNFTHDKHGNIQNGLVNRRALEQTLIDSGA